MEFNTPIYLIDFRNTFFRMYYGMPELSDWEGNNTQALYGCSRLINTLYEHAQLHYSKNPIIIVCDDSKEDTYRKEKYDNYKATRVKEERPEDFYKQLKLVYEFYNSSKITILSLPKYEADDIIASIAKRLSEEEHDVYIVSSDKDLCQLVVNRHTFVFDGIKKITWHYGNIKDRFGIPVENIVDYLSLTGDKSDNIPWVAWIGKVWATKLINNIWSIEEIYAAIEDEEKQKEYLASKVLSPSTVKKLIEWKKDAFFSKDLVTLYDIPIDTKLVLKEEFSPKNINKELLKKYKINSML